MVDPSIAALIERKGWPLSDADQEACVREMAKCLVDELAPRRVFLFGSRARGDHCAESDVDLLIEVDGTQDARGAFNLALSARAALRAVPLAKDVVVVGHDEFEARANSHCDIVSYAMEDAKLLYERAG